MISKKHDEKGFFINYGKFESSVVLSLIRNPLIKNLKGFLI